MAFKKITDADLKGKGNVGRPDTPGVSTAEMQRIMDEIPREVIIPAFNALVNALNGVGAAGSSGAQVPATLPDGTESTVQGVLDALAKQEDDHIKNKENPHDVSAKQVKAEIPEELPKETDAQTQAILNALATYTRKHKQDKNNPHGVAASQVGATAPPGLPESTGKTIQAVADAIMQFAKAHTERTDNPHSVTANQVGAYTKSQTDEAIDQKIADIGIGDMSQAVYDPQDKATDIFSVIQYFSEMSITNSWESPLSDNDGAFIVDDDGFVLLADWKYKEA